MSDTIKFLKVRDVKSPSRSNAYDAGIDFYIPELTEEFVKLLKEKNPTIESRYITTRGIWFIGHHRILIPSGIHCQMSEPGKALIAANKSGVASRDGLIFGAQVVDYEYQGEIHLSLINTSNTPVTLTSGMKILQFIEMPVFHSNISIEENKKIEEFYEKTTNRGPKGFGSTDNQ